MAYYLFRFPESWFPGATGLEYIDEGCDLPVALVERGGKFLEPVSGWGVAGRVYRCIFPAEAAAQAAAPKAGEGTPQST